MQHSVIKCLTAILLPLLGVVAGLSAADGHKAAVAELVKTQFLAWAEGDGEQFRATLHPDVTFAWPGKRLDYDGVVAAFEDWCAAFEDTEFDFHRMLVDGNDFALEYRFSSTRISTGARQSVGTVAIGEVRDGRIFVLKEYLDGRVSRLQEAGELPVDEGEEPFPWPDTPASRLP